MDFNSRAIAVFKIAYTIKCMAYEPYTNIKRTRILVALCLFACDAGAEEFHSRGIEVYYQICLCVPIMWRDDDRSTLIDEPLSYKVVKFMKISKCSTARLHTSIKLSYIYCIYL